MKINAKKSFVIIIVVASLAVLLLIAWAIVSIGCGEILNTNMRNDLVSAYYVGSAGAEYLYAYLDSSSTVIWPTSASGNLSAGGVNIGTYSASANIISASEFTIVSTGTVNGHRAKAIVTYGYYDTFLGGVPLGSIGPMTLTGASQPAKLKIEGPAMSNSTITQIGAVTITNGIITGYSFVEPSFWLGAKFDTDGNGEYAADANGDGKVTWGEAQSQSKEAAFTADNKYNPIDNVIDDNDAFYWYYTGYLNDPANNQTGQNLGIAPGGSRYYSGDQSFAVGSVPNDVPIIFVDGNVTIDKNDQEWQGAGTLNHTIVAMGDISITQPTNRPGDVLTIVAKGDVYTTGTMGNQGGTIGDIIIYADGNFTAEDGGKANASIFAKGTVTINTIGDDQGADHRQLNASTIDWTDPADRPLGLPPDYAVISTGFGIENESTHKSIWQRG